MGDEGNRQGAEPVLLGYLGLWLGCLLPCSPRVPSLCVAHARTWELLRAHLGSCFRADMPELRRHLRASPSRISQPAEHVCGGSGEELVKDLKGARQESTGLSLAGELQVPGVVAAHADLLAPAGSHVQTRDAVFAVEEPAVVLGVDVEPRRPALAVDVLHLPVAHCRPYLVHE